MKFPEIPKSLIEAFKKFQDSMDTLSEVKCEDEEQREIDLTRDDCQRCKKLAEELGIVGKKADFEKEFRNFISTIQLEACPFIIRERVMDELRQIVGSN